MTFRNTSDANWDLAEILQFYEKSQMGLGSDVIDDIENTIHRAIENPEGYPVIQKDQHRIMCEVFKIGIIYEICTDHLLILEYYDLRSDPENPQPRRK